jgi:hypothetical protein
MLLKDPKDSSAFPLALLSSALVGVLLTLVEMIGMNKTALLDDSDIVGLCPCQKGSSSVLILLSYHHHGSYFSLSLLWISVLSRGTQRSHGFSREFSPYFCTELASRCRRSFGDLLPGGTNGQVFAS